MTDSEIGRQLLFFLGLGNSRCAAECAVRFEPLCANTGFFDTLTMCFRAGLVVGK